MKNIGIIGCGHIAATHVMAYQQLGYSVVACCDSDHEKGMIFSEKHGLDFYSDYHHLLMQEEVECVSICSPHYLHYEMTRAALKAGKHVLCEKPMALNVSEGKEIIQQLKRSKSIYGVCYQNRFNQTSLRLKELLRKDFGKLKGVKCFIAWHREAEYYSESSWRGKKATEGGGVLINQAIHTFDLLTWLIGKPEKIKGKVMTTLLDQLIEVEDTAMATAVLPNGAPVSIFATNCYSSDPSPEIHFDFENTQIKLTMDQLEVNGQLLYEEEATCCEIGKSYWGDGHIRMIEAFMEKVKGAEGEYLSYVAEADALDSLQMVEGIYVSNRENTWINL